MIDQQRAEEEAYVQKTCKQNMKSIVVTSLFHCQSIIIPRSHQCGEANEY